MKKTAFIIFIILITSISPLALAAGGFGYAVDSSIVKLSQDGTAEISIYVTDIDKIAGAQFELILSDGISIEGISFDNDRGSGTIPPTFARGSYFFSLISGTNEYEGNFVCTVSILYEGTEPVQIIITEIQTHFIVSPGNVETTINDTQTVIDILPYEYWTIEDEQTPLALIKQNWIWFVIAAAVIVFAVLVFIIVRQQGNLKAAKALFNNNAENTTNAADKTDEKKSKQAEDSGSSTGEA